ncbi:MAG: DNA polymerase III subunit alpha [Candidatus Hydrogenedentota bacterium]
MVHLEVHSHYSLLEGTASVRQLVARAVEHGMGALALVDTDGMHGAVPFYQAARAAGVHPLIGVRLGDAVLLARDRAGYGRLCGIITAVRLGKVSVDALGQWPFDFDAGGLFLMSGNRRLIEQWVGSGFQPLVMLTHYGGGRSHYHVSRLYDYAKARGLRPVAVRPAHFLDPAHYRTHRVLAAIRHNTTVDCLRRDEVAPAEHHFLPPRQMERLYGDWPGALMNTEWVAEQCGVQLELGTPLFPQMHLPRGESAFSVLWKKTFAGAETRYHTLTPAIMDRLHYELGIIEQLGFAPYFLIVEDIVRFARERDIPVSGRGSAANSVVAYALGITRVDPFEYGLYFERFLNLERTDCPDIDIDFCWRRRDEVVEYVYERYGRDRVAMICTFHTFRARAALREVAKAHGLTDKEVGAVIRHVPHYGAGDLRRLAAHIPECRGLPLDEEPWAGILDVAERIDGQPRHVALHPCGLVIAPERLTNFVPLQRAAKGFVVTQYDMGPIEALGLIKMDLLGHRSLTVISDTLASIETNRGQTVDIEAVQDGDPLTAELLCAGQTIGCFQIESPAMRGLLPKLRTADIDMVIKALSLIRPGPSGSGMKERFIARCRGEEPADYIHPALAEVLGDTYGVMLYQEDILKVAAAVAGMSLAEADGLRRAMSKKRGPGEMARHMQTFVEKAVAAGASEAVAQEIWERIANFAAYSYCKAHAATYGEIAYQCTYLKAHYAPEFLAAVLTNRGGFYAPHVYLEEAKRLGVEVRPPCVNRSRYEYTPEDDAMRVGFVEVRNLNEKSVDAILDARAKDGPFRSLTDLLERTGIPFADAEALFQAGALDGLTDAGPRPMQMWALRTWAGGKRAAQVAEPLVEYGVQQHIPLFPDYCWRRYLDQQWTALGLLANPRAHPLQYYQALLQERQLVLSSDLTRFHGQVVRTAGWLIAQRRVALKDGRGIMKFMTLEDPGGTYEVVVFPETYQTYGHLLTSLGPYIVTGKVQREHDAHALIAAHIERVGEGLTQAG